ncbi:FAD:protein FMN transferase [Aquisalimonas sp.]|uniref:FAD:protein FMN transferase n=1 Tax=Aquisalimonas sp. TaxID=1872621 RepID=UPI0025BB9C65|nr:FAD:protein FMN transferase [Aquisalimonas sp.]
MAVRWCMRGLRVVLLPAICLLAVACGQPPQVQTLSGASMGTTWSVQFVAAPGEDDVAAVRADIEAALERVNAQMSTYREDSHISRFNRAAPGESITLPPDFTVVLLAAKELAEQTDGAYDPTVGPLVNVWGFGPDGPRSEAPAEDAIEAARARVGWQQLALDRDTRALTQPGGVYLDLSSIAKGYAADLIAERLETRGITAYLVDIGGDMRVRGRKPDGERWRIAIERPVPGERAIQSVIQPGDKAVATSGSYRQFFREGDREFSHTIDPRTGYPTPQELVSVTVLHDNAKEADGLATAIMALGPEAGYAFAREQDVAVLLLVRDDDTVEERMTPAFAPYVDEETD